MKNAVSNNTEIRIEHALFELMRERDYSQIGVTDIAETAGIGRATFYRYFKRKEEVIAAYFTRNAEAFGPQNCPKCKSDYAQIVRAVLKLSKQKKSVLRLYGRHTWNISFLIFSIGKQGKRSKTPTTGTPRMRRTFSRAQSLMSARQRLRRTA